MKKIVKKAETGGKAIVVSGGLVTMTTARFDSIIQ